jgi:hypothetical protein
MSIIPEHQIKNSGKKTMGRSLVSTARPTIFGFNRRLGKNVGGIIEAFGPVCCQYGTTKKIEMLASSRSQRLINSHFTPKPKTLPLQKIMLSTVPRPP